MRIALDSNRYTDLCRGDAALQALLESAEAVLLPFVVLAELRAGFAIGARSLHNNRALEAFLAKPGIDVLYAGEATARHYAALYRQLRQQGTPIPTNDLWIAALAVEHDLALCTRDGHFAKVAQVRVV